MARWPITSGDVALRDLIAAAREEVPDLAARARCRITGRGSWAVVDARDVPGSGQTTPNVLLFQAPAVAVVRDYHKAAAPPAVAQRRRSA